MMAWEKEVYRLDLNRALLIYDFEQLLILAYSSMYARRLEIAIKALEYNIAVYRKMKPLHIKSVSHHLLIVEIPQYH